MILSVTVYNSFNNFEPSSIHFFIWKRVTCSPAGLSLRHNVHKDADKYIYLQYFQLVVIGKICNKRKNILKMNQTNGANIA